MTHLNRVCVSPCYYFMSLSHTVSEIFSVKEWSDLENGTIQKLGYGFLLEACTGLGLTGNPRVPRVARGFGIRSTRVTQGVGLLSICSPAVLGTIACGSPAGWIWQATILMLCWCYMDLNDE